MLPQMFVRRGSAQERPEPTHQESQTGSKRRRCLTPASAIVSVSSRRPWLFSFNLLSEAGFAYPSPV